MENKMELTKKHFELTSFYFFSRYLYIDISKSALAKFTTTEGLTSKFSTEHNVDLDVSNLGTDPIHYCLTGNVSYSKSSEISI